MPALKKTDFAAIVNWLGLVPNRDEELCSVSKQNLTLNFSGPVGESHSGLTRFSCTRISSQHPIGTEVRNVRQVSIVAGADLERMSQRLELEMLDPAWLGATIVLSGIPDLSHLPPSSRLQSASGATLVVDMENRPCNLPARTIEAMHPSHGKKFMKIAKGIRGLTAWVEREGVISVGEKMVLSIPDQPVWRHLYEVIGDS